MTVESGRRREMKRVSSLSSNTLVCRGGGRRKEASREKEAGKERERRKGAQRTDTI